ncbi:GGDEF domain-containing response regulator [Desulfobacula toluolica]|uniref:diguanylate cyclase n=1 Tax=Desulfobacula toluolica (strain DSM 7467 / Tol2) TaxID=651182 RepID=K0NHF7_DESTT|nr:diguanylate cyclase response regulator [Desulfobacula toluolica]CCK79303.1 response regulator with adenylyl cyclase catalytic domain(GGDEF domain) [Desulfobacula toluolica Tol2]
MGEQTLKLLVIDDDPADIELLRRNIADIPDMSVEFTSLSTSIKDQAVLSSQSADLVFIDYLLGSHTGIDVFQAMKEAGCCQPMIMLTGMGNEFIAVEAMKAGFADYIVKEAMEPSHLRRAITYALEKASLMQQLEEQRKQLEKLARIDDLTGLYNRRYFFERFTMEVSRAVRYGQPFSVLMIDLDHFKHVNDTYGHLFGDEVLARTGKNIQIHTRNTDISGRYGGEEFCIGLSSTGLAGAEEFAERMRQRIENEKFIAPDGQTVQVTCSIGIALVDEYDQNVSRSLDCADQALYEAKSLGRNRVVVWKAFNDLKK